MPNQNSVDSEVFSHHDQHTLFSEVAQMTKGNIGFGVYPDLKDNEEIDLFRAGDQNTELGEDNYLFGPDPDGEGVLLCEGDGDPFGENENEDRVNPWENKAIFYLDHPVRDYLLNRAPAKNICCMRSEVLTTRCHRSIKRLKAESRKHQQFYGNLRVR